MTAAALAPAKVNLFLHVGPPDDQGYHPLVSLMTFADLGDRLQAAPARDLSLSIGGPFGAGLSAGEDNLVLRAVRALLAHCGCADAGLALTLDKRLPLAAGLGGGSSDAGAALRLANRVLGLAQDEATLEVLAASLGADGAACLRARPVIAEGRGERLTPAPAWPDLPCVLVNPRLPSPTGAVYRAYDAERTFSSVEAPDLPEVTDPASAAAALSILRNDLEAPAIALEPGIGPVLDRLRAAPQALLARMSGSGATCFALCADMEQARVLADEVNLAHPDWWVQACRLMGER